MNLGFRGGRLWESVGADDLTAWQLRGSVMGFRVPCFGPCVLGCRIFIVGAFATSGLGVEQNLHDLGLELRALWV